MDYSGLLNLQIMIFMLMGIGVILKKIGIIDDSGKKVVTDLVIYLFLPCNIINAFMIEFNKDILISGLTILGISFVIQLMCTFISATCYKKIPKQQRMVLQYGTVCSNAGFLGNPVAEGLYGPVGLLYASIYLIPQRIVMWSAGISYFTESPNKKEVLKRVLSHPCIIAVEIGIVIMLFQIPMPIFLDKTINSIGGCATVTSMILIGTILADVDMSTLVTQLTVVYSFLRLLLIPLLVLVGCLLFQVDSLITGLSVILASMPAGSTTAILAAKYEGDAEFATKCVVLTTILSMVMIPIWCMILTWIG